MDGTARILYVNGRRDAAGRIRDELAEHNGEDRRFTSGRLVEGLTRALELIDPDPVLPDGPWETHIGTVVSHVDTVDVGLYLGNPADYPPDENADPYPDILPVRLRVEDGGESVGATGYLTPDEADELAGHLMVAARRARDAADAHALLQEGPRP